MSANIYIGDTFGKWTVVNPKTENGGVDVVCECGNTQQFRKHILLEGYSRQCSRCARDKRRACELGTVFYEPPLSEHAKQENEKCDVMVKAWLKTNKATKC